MFSKIPLTALRAFESAARLGGFKAASEELSVTPAAVSHQIKSLESWLGVLLFKRTRKGVCLTAEGEGLYHDIHRSLVEISRGIEAFRPIFNNEELTISTTPAFASLWLIPRLGSFYEKYPEFHIRVETSNEAVDLLRNPSVDIAIRCGFRHFPDLCEIFLMEESFHVYSPPGWSLDRANEFELINVRWSSPSPASIDWNAWCSMANHEDWLGRSLRREYDDEHHALQAAISGHGLVLASNVLVADSVSRGLLVPYKPEIKIPGANYIALSAPGRERHSPLKEFLRWLVQQSTETRLV